MYVCMYVCILGIYWGDGNKFMYVCVYVCIFNLVLLSENTVEENKIAQGRARIAYEKEKEKLREFISREGKKYDNPAHQAQVHTYIHIFIHT